MENPYTEVGGSLVGYMNSTFPFATLSVTQDRISITTVTIFLGKKEFSIPKDQIRAITKYRGFFSSGIHISVYDDVTPEPLVFWTFNFSNLRQNLEARGYTLS